jgi:cytidylate kinase
LQRWQARRQGEADQLPESGRHLPALEEDLAAPPGKEFTMSRTTSRRLAEAFERARAHWSHSPVGDIVEGEIELARRPSVIAIRREAGTRGGTVARMVGEHLGWPVYDQELIEYIAAQTTVWAELLESLSDEQRAWLRECVDRLLGAPSATQACYARHVAETVLAVAVHGRCIILGRGAAQILPLETTLRVRLVGPLEERVRAVRDRFGVSDEVAAARVDRTDRERVRFIRDHLLQDPADVWRYDLVLNASRLDAETCTRLILEALRTREASVPALVALS